MRRSIAIIALIASISPATAQRIHQEPVPCRLTLEPWTGPADRHGSGGYQLVARFLVPAMTYPRNVQVRAQLKRGATVVYNVSNVPPPLAWKQGSWTRFFQHRYMSDPGLSCSVTLSYPVKERDKVIPKARIDGMGPIGKVDRKVPALPRPLATATGGYVDTIDGRRESIVFKRGTQHRIEGKGLAGGTAAWLIGPDGGGSVLTIRQESDTRLLVTVSDIAGARTSWPAGRTIAHAKALKIRIEADHGNRIFEFDLPNSVYSCRAGELNCGR